MADEQKRATEREAKTGDPEAEKRVRVERCRAGECCAYAGVTTTHETQGCEGCPLLGWDNVDDAWRCNLNAGVTIPTNDDGVLAALPTGCPLWREPVTVDLFQLRLRGKR